MARGELKKRVDTWTKWFITRGGDRAAEKDHRGACLGRAWPARFSVINLILGFWGWVAASRATQELIHLRLSHPFPGTTLRTGRQSSQLQRTPKIAKRLFQISGSMSFVSSKLGKVDA